MAVIAFTSFAGSPGVSTAALAFAVHWPRPVVVLEADMNAVTSSMAGFFRSNLPPTAGGLDKIALAYSRGVLSGIDLLDPQRGLAIAVHELPAVEQMPIPTIPPEHRLWVVPGFFHLNIVDGVRGLWSNLPHLLRSLSEAGIDVLVDLSRLGREDIRLPLIDAADRVVVCASATMVDLNRIYRRIEVSDLAQRLDGVGRAEKFWLLLNDAIAEQIPTKDFAEHIMPVLASLPFDPAGAATFSLGKPDAKPARNNYRQAIRRAVALLDGRTYSDLDRRVG